MNLYIGCPIWANKGWVGSFYPEGTKPSAFLREYASRLTTVEGNTTFYAVPSPATVQQWVAETPETFRFCPKLPRAISHAGKLTEHIQEAQQFVDVMRGWGDRLGPMFLQLPPTYSPEMLADLKAFLEAWSQPFRIGVEVRHPAWFGPPHDEALNELLTANRMGRVVIDTRPIRSLQNDRILAGSVYKRLLEARLQKPDLPVFPKPTADFVFLRYIGHPQAEVNTPYLDGWASFLVERLQEGMDAYVFCHCPDERLDPWLCRQLYRQVSSVAGLSLPPLPWDNVAPDVPHQARLF